MYAVLLVVVPVFFVALSGYAYGRWISTRIDEVNRINLDLFVPALLIYVLSEKLGKTSGAMEMLLAGSLVIAGSGVVAAIAGRWLKMDFKTLGPPLMFNNSANLGFPLAVLAFGDEILPYSVVLFLVQAISMFTFGFMIYERRFALGQLIRNPIIIAMSVGLVCYAWDLHAPAMLLPGLKMLSEVAIPLTLVTLGVKLAEADWSHWRDGLVGAVLRPLGGLPFGLLAVWLIPMSDALKPLVVLFSVLPPAVLNAPLAARYGQEPEKVASMVMVGNLLTVLYMPVVLFFLLMPS
ncbi:AEC family transporter [Thiolapillus brandeum]|uniref:AEC family transporter n=1 Tax=Thiolapillus brandeum TaxID=1076588 RepID=UPI00059777BD|nr:AEC family transporter [Thiolapillus brandeum]